MGIGHAPSGNYGVGSIDSNGNLDYGTPITFTFVSPLNGSISAITDYFSITTDNWGWSGNTIIASAYDINGNLLGSTSYTEGVGGVSLELQNIGMFHRVIVDASYYGSHGGIALDLLEFGNLNVPSVPEPSAFLLLGSGLVGFAFLRKRLKP